MGTFKMRLHFLVKVFLLFTISTSFLFNKTDAQDDGLDHLRKNIPGEPGKDYPINGPSILCKLNPRQCGGQGGSGNGGKKKKGNGGNGGQKGRNINGSGTSSSNGASNKGGNMGGQMRRKNKPAGSMNNNSKNTNNKGSSNKNSNGGGSTDELDALRKNIPGEPGKDYPINSFSIVCKLNPRQCGGGGGSANGGAKGSGGSNMNGKTKGNNQSNKNSKSNI